MTTTRHPQDPLPLVDGRRPTFANFRGDENQLALDLLSVAPLQHGEQIFLCGNNGSGKTHLLLAAHDQALQAGARSFYTSLRSAGLQSDLLEALDEFQQIAIDDVDTVCAQPDWERALFNLINDAREAGSALIFSAASAPNQQDWKLPDLRTRFGWGPIVQLIALPEDQQIELLIDSAAEYGMQFDSASARFLVSRYSRDITSLLATLPILERESLAAGRRRITIPFLKQCLLSENTEHPAI